jgi:ABC-type antimicrobial peptide transport system permease subunit
MAYSIGRRTREIGIRMALGATPRNVLALVGRQAIGMVLLGVAAGSVAALALTRMATGLLVKVSATDPRIFVGAAVFLAAVAMLAACIPALRATRVQPNTALRSQ